MHGWGRDRRDFAEVLVGLDAIAIDLPGFGTSVEPAAATGAAGYADLVAPTLDEFDGPAVLVGHSFGGRVAVHLAVLRPEKVGAMVLAGVPLLPRTEIRSRTPSASYRLIRAMHRAGWVGDDRMEQARQRYGSADYRAARGVMRDVLIKVVNESYETMLSEIQQPVQLVWGANDRDVPPEIARRAVAHLARAELTVLEGVGHQVCLEAPAAVRAAVLRAAS